MLNSNDISYGKELILRSNGTTVFQQEATLSTLIEYTM